MSRDEPELFEALAGRTSGPPGGTRAVVLAGGRGTRLAPFTSVLPKPLMPIGEHSILELVVRQLASYEIREITFCVGYLSHLIKAVFDHTVSPDSGLEISYVHESKPLGTAAPLRLVDGLDDTFLVMNGDVLTELDYRDLVRHHRASGNVLTVATHRRTIKIDYGVLHHENGERSGRIRDYEEKPEIGLTVSMGVYVLEPEVLEHIPEGERFDFPDLVQELLAADLQVGAYLFEGLWFDIGRQADYEQAVLAWENKEEFITHHYPVHVGNGDGRKASEVSS